MNAAKVAPHAERRDVLVFVAAAPRTKMQVVWRRVKVKGRRVKEAESEGGGIGGSEGEEIREWRGDTTDGCAPHANRRASPARV